MYQVAGSHQYLLVIEAIGSDGRYFRSSTHRPIDGTWSPLTATQSNPFIGEMIRTNIDQTPTILGCHMRYVQQGEDPSANGPYNSLPWRIGLLTQTRSDC